MTTSFYWSTKLLLVPPDHTQLWCQLWAATHRGSHVFHPSNNSNSCSSWNYNLFSCVHLDKLGAVRSSFFPILSPAYKPLIGSAVFSSTWDPLSPNFLPTDATWDHFLVLSEHEAVMWVLNWTTFINDYSSEYYSSGTCSAVIKGLGG